jgi:uncharacterized protein (UPF0332 family)
MNPDWAEYLEFARDLVQQASSPSLHQEAMLRSAISRAYYCAYHAARHFINQQGARTASHYNSHEGVIRWYGEQPRRQYHAVAVKLGRLKDNRVNADYRPNFQPNVSLAQTTVEEVDKVLAMISQLP